MKTYVEPFNANVSRNYNKRHTLNIMAYVIADQIDVEKAAASDLEDDEAYDYEMDRIERDLMEKLRKLQEAEFVLCFPNCRNSWFKQFVRSFTLDENIRISEKQYDAFKQRTEETANTWRDGKSYCRVDNLFITLWRSGKVPFVKIQKLNNEYLK